MAQNKHRNCIPGKGGLSVEVKNEYDFERALKKFKKKVATDGMLKELRQRQEFKRPGEVKRLAKLEAIRRQRKQHNEMRREGLVR